MKDLTKFIIPSLIAAVIGWQFLMAFKTQIRNQAIDGCAQSSFYQVEYTDAEGRHVTAREPQKSTFEKCLLDKGVNLK